MKRKRVTPEQIEIINNRTYVGESDVVIAADLGLTDTTVGKYSTKFWRDRMEAKNKSNENN